MTATPRFQARLNKSYRKMVADSPHLTATKEFQGDIQVRVMSEGAWSDWRTLVLPVADNLAELLLAPRIASVRVDYVASEIPEAMEWRLEKPLQP